MKRLRPVVTPTILLLSIISFAIPAQAHRPERYFKKILPPPQYEEQTLTGDWGGVRDDMYQSGVTITSTYVCDVLGCVAGGKDQGARYDHSLGLDINFDLEQMADIKGMQFHVSGLYRAGRSLSSDVIGNKFVVSSIYGHEQFRFYWLYLEQALFDDKVNIRVGRIASGDDFARSDIYWIYMNNGIDGMPISIPINFAFPVYPTATWGARSIIKFNDLFYATSGIYNADPDVGRDDMYGLDFSMRLSRGILGMQEIAFTPNTAKDAEGYPGHYKVGGFVVSGEFDDLYANASGESFVMTGDAPKKHKANYGCYFHADQMLYREGGPGTDQGLTAFSIITLAPSNTNLFPFFWDGGIFYKGLIPTRDNDIAAFGIVYGTWSPDNTHSEQIRRDVEPRVMDPPKYELVLEFTYKLQITPWVFVQPDFQMVFHPGGTAKVPDAYVVGGRFGLSF